MWKNALSLLTQHWKKVSLYDERTLIERLKKLGWHHTANQLDSLLEDASKDNVSYSEFLHTIVLHETEQQDSDQLEKRMKRAKLPYTKTIHDFDFTFQPSLSEKRVKETNMSLYCQWGKSHITGSSGCRKTHLAVSFAIEAITRIYSPIFVGRRLSGSVPQGQ